jgi:hypothetical protein
LAHPTSAEGGTLRRAPAYSSQHVWSMLRCLKTVCTACDPIVMAQSVTAVGLNQQVAGSRYAASHVNAILLRASRPLGGDTRLDTYEIFFAARGKLPQNTVHRPARSAILAVLYHLGHSTHTPFLTPPAPPPSCVCAAPGLHCRRCFSAFSCATAAHAALSCTVCVHAVGVGCGPAWESWKPVNVFGNHGACSPCMRHCCLLAVE